MSLAFLHRLIAGSPPPLLIFLFLLSTSISSILCSFALFNLHLLLLPGFLPTHPPTPPTHLPPLNAAAIPVLGGGHGHASLSGLINHPRSWQPGPPPGANGAFFYFFLTAEKHEF